MLRNAVTDNGNLRIALPRVLHHASLLVLVSDSGTALLSGARWHLAIIHCSSEEHLASWQRRDEEQGGDSWAVQRGWVAVTPLGLLQDYALRDAHLQRGRAFVAACAKLVRVAAEAAGVQAGGCEGAVAQGEASASNGTAAAAL